MDLEVIKKTQLSFVSEIIFDYVRDNASHTALTVKLIVF